jgi:hypothetical protein
LEQTCAFFYKLSDNQRCDLRVNEFTALVSDEVLGVFSYKGTSPPT